MKCPYCKGTGELTPKTTGEMIKLIRLGKGWNQQKLCKEADLHPGMLSAIEHDRNMTILTLKKVAKALNVKAGDLLPS